MNKKLKDDNTTIVVSHYNEDLSWVEKIKSSYSDIKIYTKNNPNSEFNVPINVGNEASAYLLYIIEHYDTFKDYTIFLHGHEFSWHHNGSITNLLTEIDIEDKLFININNKIMGSILENPRINDIKNWYNECLKSELGDISLYGDWTVGFGACAQFVVHKTLIKKRTKKFYENLYKWILETKLPSSLSGRYLEWTWHLIWGQVPHTK